MRENTGFVLHLHTQNDAKTWKASQIVINPLTKGLLVLICSAVSTSASQPSWYVRLNPEGRKSDHKAA